MSRSRSAPTCRCGSSTWHFWNGVLTGDLGVSIYDFPAPRSPRSSSSAMPYTLALLVPAIVLSYILGNRLGAAAARRKFLDNTVLPLGYFFQAIPYPWLALVLPFLFGAVWHVFPTSPGLRPDPAPARSRWTFISSLLYHWFLPFLTVFLVSLGGWAIGMRNLVIYELENDSSRYLRALGARERVVRRYAYRNASLPQLSGLALASRRRHRRQHRHRDRLPLPGPRLLDLQRDRGPGLLPAAGHLHLHRHRRAARELHHRPRVHHGRPEDPAQHARNTVSDMLSGSTAPRKPGRGRAGGHAGGRGRDASRSVPPPARGRRRFPATTRCGTGNWSSAWVSSCCSFCRRSSARSSRRTTPCNYFRRHQHPRRQHWLGTDLTSATTCSRS